jgi:hypothetical protein
VGVAVAELNELEVLDTVLVDTVPEVEETVEVLLDAADDEVVEMTVPFLMYRESLLPAPVFLIRTYAEVEIRYTYRNILQCCWRMAYCSLYLRGAH